MAITVPTIGSEIDVVTFGKPVVDAINGMGVRSSWVPTLSQGVIISKTVTVADFTRNGNRVSAEFLLVATSAGTAGSSIIVGWPNGLAPMVPGSFVVLGAGYISGQPIGYWLATTPGMTLFKPDGSGQTIGIANGWSVTGQISFLAT